MTLTALSLAFIVAAAGEAPAPFVDNGAPLFTRDEPHLEEGAELLAAGAFDAALEKFRAAEADTQDERAVVEYDIGAALLARAAHEMKTQQAEQQRAAAQGAQPGMPGGPGVPGGPQPSAGPPGKAPAPPAELDDARASFERAFSLARDRMLKSEAALANGNAAFMGGKLDDAIAEYRKSIVADPKNERAKLNLRRALEAKRQQPPPPPQSSGGESDESDEQKDEEQQPQEKGEEKSKPDEKKGDEQKKQPDEKEGDKKEPGDDEQQKPDEKEGDKKKEEKPEPNKPTDKKAQKKEEARRLLEALKAREKPLTPMEMRGVKKQQPKQGKDW